MALVAQQDRAALTELYARYAGSAYRVATRLTRRHALAEDVVQEAFLEIWKNARRYDRTRGTARSWILAIAHHRGVDALRRTRPTRQLPETDTFQPTEFVLPDAWPEVARRVRAREVRAALSKLPPPMRQAIVLAFFGGLTHVEIAAATGTPLGTVKSRIRLGLLGLRATLEADPIQAASSRPGVRASRPGGKEVQGRAISPAFRLSGGHGRAPSE